MLVALSTLTSSIGSNGDSIFVAWDQKKKFDIENRIKKALLSPCGKEEVDDFWSFLSKKDFNNFLKIPKKNHNLLNSDIKLYNGSDSQLIYMLNEYKIKHYLNINIDTKNILIINKSKHGYYAENPEISFYQFCNKTFKSFVKPGIY